MYCIYIQLLLSTLFHLLLQFYIVKKNITKRDVSFANIERGLVNLKEKYNYDITNQKIKEIENKLQGDVDIWSKNFKKANSLTKELGIMEKALREMNELEKEIVDVKELYTICTNEGEYAQVDLQFEKLNEKISQLEIEALLSSKEDRLGAYIEINSGAGDYDC